MHKSSSTQSLSSSSSTPSPQMVATTSSSSRSESPRGSASKLLSQTLYDFSSGVGLQLKNLVITLDKNNYRGNVSEIEKILKQYGFEAYRTFLTILLTSLNFYNITQKDKPKLQLLSQEFAKLTTQTNFSSIILKAFSEGVTENGLKVEFISQFSRTLNLPLSQQVLLGIALAESHSPNVQKEGFIFLKTKLQEMLDEGLVNLLPENLAHKFLFLVNTNVNNFSSDELDRLKDYFLRATIPSPNTSSIITTTTNNNGSSRGSSANIVSSPSMAHTSGQHSISILPQIIKSSTAINSLR
ncbi:predicted protein [Naegleria gruberi]|uniref:Predicted protein n=1 Tax=Naegleria gruberi TaxID=5762 RepID=D2V2Z6_NAEGR|nr:uncharacterized protein NAEGRDRAFT_63171 [Naegleria gruberi]EFC48538.1 predicted protein [Naegleria gruberi]|eukprot:XP_002681282.1 predicted protein [Naegleria gruberi strain NEG-M]